MYQLIYLSTATRLMEEKDLADLLEESRRNNLDHQITGLLLYLDGTFIQVIEGEEEKIRTLISNIIDDERNKDLQILNEDEIESRHFHGWSMGFLKIPVRELSKLEGFASIRHADDFRPLMKQEGLALGLLRGFYTSTMQPTSFGKRF